MQVAGVKIQGRSFWREYGFLFGAATEQNFGLDTMQNLVNPGNIYFNGLKHT